jgi:uncharacterized membrane protein
MRSFALVLAVLVMGSFTPPVGAQEPARKVYVLDTATGDVKAVDVATKSEVADLRAELAELRKQLTDLTGAQVKAAPKAGACPCGESCPCAAAVLSSPPAAPAAAACLPGQPCYQPSYQPVTGVFASPAAATGSACAGGSCAAPASYRFAPFGGRFRR